jgi:hypothetical protein
LAFISTPQATAQESYLLKELRIPHAAQENPGVRLPFDAHVGFPSLNKIHLGLNFPFNFSNLMDISDNLLKPLRKNNAMRGWIEINPIHFGFRVKKKNYFSVTTAIKADIYIGLQKDLFSFIIEGNAPSENKEMSFIGKDFLSLNAYVEIGLGYNREINDNLSFGVNLKYLAGLFNAYTSDAALNLYTGDRYNELRLNYALQAKMSAIVDVEDVAFDNLNAKAIFANSGFAFDLGARYRISELFEVSGAVLDIGFIQWKSYPKQYNIDGKEFSFTGIHYDNIFDDSMNIKDFSASFSEIVDSLANSLTLSMEDASSYIKWLNTRFHVGGSIYASPKDRFNITFNGEFYNGLFIPSGSISYHRTCGRWFDFVIGNTFKSNAIFNPGIGLNFTLGVFQLYTVLDYTNNPFYIDKMKNLNVVFGINFVAPLKKEAIYIPSF